MTIQLPTQVANYFKAANEGTPAQVAQCFAPQGVVHDEEQRLQGHAAIAAWSAAARARYGARATPLAGQATLDGIEVRSRVEGNFPGSPIELGFLFQLNGEDIASLRIRAT